MRTLSAFVIATSVLLSACGVSGQNPITASRYADELADLLASLIILKDPIVEEPGMKEYLQSEIVKAKKMGDDAREVLEQGLQGMIIAGKEEAAGYAVYTENRLFLSSDFYVPPGPDLHVYLTTVVDPRDGVFPDDSAMDLGKLKTPYGEQTYSVKEVEKPETYRTLAVYDKKLKRLYGFAQLAKTGQ